MTREEFETMSFEELMEWAMENLDDVISEDSLKSFAIESIQNDRYYLASHIADALAENWHNTNYYRYDFSMGTLEEPTPIRYKEDIEDLIDFEED